MRGEFQASLQQCRKTRQVVTFCIISSQWVFSNPISAYSALSAVHNPLGAVALGPDFRSSWLPLGGS